MTVCASVPSLNQANAGPELFGEDVWSKVLITAWRAAEKTAKKGRAPINHSWQNALAVEQNVEAQLNACINTETRLGHRWWQDPPSKAAYLP